jgi:hypothetical protein
MEAIRAAICDVVDEHRPMTVRQVFYQMAVRGVVPKQERRGYQTVQRLLVEMRRSGRVDYEDIVDSSRTVRRPTTFDSMEDALLDTADMYRRGLWGDTGVYVQIWLEKEALTGVLWDVTDQWDVPLWVSRGYGSISYLHIAAKYVAQALSHGRTVYIYNVGDHDPSGVNAWHKLQETLTEFAGQSEALNFERLAVTPEQIERWNLPSRPTKSSDTRTKTWEGGESVEVDAIPPRQLKAIVQQAIERHISSYELERIKQLEQQERQTLKEYAELWLE